MAKLSGTNNLNDEQSWRLDSGFRSTLYRVDLGQVSFGELTAIDFSDWYELRLPGRGSYRLTISNDSANNYSPANAWSASVFGVMMEITDANGLLIPGLPSAITTSMTDGSIVFDYAGSGAPGSTFVRLTNLSIEPLDYAITLERVAGTDGLNLIGTNGADHLQGGSGGDSLSGLAGRDLLVGGGGADTIDGGPDIDVAMYASSKRNYYIGSMPALGTWLVADVVGDEGADTLTGIERLSFTDTNVALDFNGSARSVAQIIRAVIGPAALDLPLYVGYGLQAADDGATYSELVALAVSASPLAGANSREFVGAVYRNVFGAQIDAATLDLFAGLVDTGSYTKATLADLASRQDANVNSVEIVGLAATGIDYVLPPG